jgi:transcriptional regulator with XRE-family HTH domain
LSGMGEVLRFPTSVVDRPVEPLWREAVGAELRRTRIDRAERLSDVAGRAGVSTQYLSEVERGLKDPSSEILAAVAGALELTVRELVSRTAATECRVRSA